MVTYGLWYDGNLLSCENTVMEVVIKAAKYLADAYEKYADDAEQEISIMEYRTENGTMQAKHVAVFSLWNGLEWDSQDAVEETHCDVEEELVDLFEGEEVSYDEEEEEEV